MDVRSAELTKYAANAMLATKISFMNELANLAERLGADIERVRIGIGSDPRIGFQFIWPRCGYGGSCFPKDVQALVRTAQQAGYVPELLQAVEAVNQFQKQRLHRLISQHFGGDGGLAGRRLVGKPVKTRKPFAVVRVYCDVIGTGRVGRCRWVGFENRSLVLRALSKRPGFDRAAVAGGGCDSSLARARCVG